MSGATIDGDPEVVTTLARQYVSTARSMLDASTRLRRLEAGATTSEAVEAFLVKASDLAHRLDRVQGRYDESGAALLDYADALRDAIDAATAARRDEERADDDLDAAERLQRHHQGAADAAVDGVQKDHDQLQAERHRLLAEDAAGRAAVARAALTAAREDRDRAAERAISRLDDATDDGVVDAPFDDFAGWMRDNDEWISVVLDVMGDIALVLTALSLICPFAWIGVALIALTVLAAAGAIARAAAGTGSWTDAVLAVVSVLTLGVGTTLSSAVRSETAALRATRTSALEASGASPALTRAWISKTWDRLEPRVGSEVLRRALGDVDIAKALLLMKAGRPGQVDGDTVRLALAVTRARRFAAVDYATGVTQEVLSSTPWFSTLGARTTRRLEWGTAW